MKADDTIPEFRLFGGPLHRLGARLGLVRGRTNTVWLGVALGLLLWSVAVLLGILVGNGPKVLSLSLIGMHVRLLVAIPLFFLCETAVAPRMAEFVRGIVRTGVVPESERPELDSLVRRVDRLKDPWLVEIALLLIVAAFVLVEPLANLPGKTANASMLLTEAGGRVGPFLGWYLWICLPIVRFLLLRWLWHLGLWCYFLWRVQKLELHLVPTHPDYVAGLGYLEVVQTHFVPLSMAISAILAGSFWEDISSGTMAFETLYLMIPSLMFLGAVLFVGPLLIFSAKLWRCRIAGWSEYMGMASRYVNDFDRKWIRGENAAGETLLGTADMQSLADLSSSVEVVRNMRWLPFSRRLFGSLAASVIIPMLPLVFLKYHFNDLAAKLFQTLTGL
jgi:hypothetical protein